MHDLLIRGATVVDGLGHARSAPTSRSRMVGRPASAARRADRRRNRTLTSCPARDPRSALRSGAASAPSVKASMRAAEASEYFRSCTPRASHKGVPAVSGTSSSNPLCSSGESVSAGSRGRCRSKSRLWRRSGFGLGREKGRDGCDQALFGPVSLTGIDAVPLRQTQPGRNDAPAAVGAATCGISLGCEIQLASRLRCSLQSNGRPSSVKRVAVSSMGCRPCKIASTSSGLRKARPTSRRM